MWTMKLIKSIIYTNTHTGRTFINLIKKNSGCGQKLLEQYYNMMLLNSVIYILKKGRLLITYMYR